MSSSKSRQEMNDRELLIRLDERCENMFGAVLEHLEAINGTLDEHEKKIEQNTQTNIRQEERWGLIKWVVGVAGVGGLSGIASIVRSFLGI